MLDLRATFTEIWYSSITLRLLKDDPTAFVEHLGYFGAGTIFEVSSDVLRCETIFHLIFQTVYGIKIESANDPIVKTADQALEVLEGVLPGKFFVDAIPIREALVFKSNLRYQAKYPLSEICA